MEMRRWMDLRKRVASVMGCRIGSVLKRETQAGRVTSACLVGADAAMLGYVVKTFC